MTAKRTKKLKPTRKNWKLWENHLQKLARQDIASIAPNIDRADPHSSFDLMVSLVSMGDADDQFLLDQFRRAKLNVEDPFHWWHLLIDLLNMFKRGEAGRPRFWTEAEQSLFKAQCVRAGLLHPPTKSIAKICQRLADEGVRTESPEHLKIQVTRFRLTEDIKTAIARKLRRA